jgi:hypothetical protein
MINKQRLQKLAGLLKEDEDFDLSDNPVAGASTTCTFYKTIAIDFSKEFTIDLKDFAAFVKEEYDDDELDLESKSEIESRLFDYLDQYDLMDGTDGWDMNGYSEYGNDDIQSNLEEDFFSKENMAKLKKYLNK